MFEGVAAPTLLLSRLSFSRLVRYFASSSPKYLTIRSLGRRRFPKPRLIKIDPSGIPNGLQKRCLMNSGNQNFKGVYNFIEICTCSILISSSTGLKCMIELRSSSIPSTHLTGFEFSLPSTNECCLNSVSSPTTSIQQFFLFWFLQFGQYRNKQHALYQRAVIAGMTA